MVLNVKRAWHKNIDILQSNQSADSGSRMIENCEGGEWNYKYKNGFSSVFTNLDLLLFFWWNYLLNKSAYPFLTNSVAY